MCTSEAYRIFLCTSEAYRIFLWVELNFGQDAASTKNFAYAFLSADIEASTAGSKHLRY